MKKTRWWALLVLVLAAIWMSPLAALAQQTGGSFGGSRWGSGSSGSRPSSSGSSWSRPSSSGSSWSRPSSGTSYGGGSYGGGSYGGGSYGGSSYGSRNSGGGLGAFCCIAFFVLIIVVIVVIAQKKGGGGRAMAPYYPPAGGPMPMPPGGMDTFAVGVLAIAFDSRARAQIQSGIAQIAERSNMAGGNGLPNAARETAQLLSQYLDAAYMTQHALSEGIAMQTAQQYFDAAVSDARGRFIVETMRNDAGGVRKVEGPRVTARAEGRRVDEKGSSSGHGLADCSVGRTGAERGSVGASAWKPLNRKINGSAVVAGTASWAGGREFAQRSSPEPKRD